MKKVLIAGGTGFIGTRVSRKLDQEGFDVYHLSRSPSKEDEFPAYKWDIQQDYLEPDALQDTEYLINVAGANLAGGRWTSSQKKKLRQSRIDANNLLFERLKDKNHSVKSFISSSAVGFYGDQGDTVLTESSPRGKGFLPTLCQEWEDAAKQVTTLGIRTTIIRFGIVLDKKEGAFPLMTKSMMVGVAFYMGHGKQYLSWIHIDDLVDIITTALTDETMEGIYNGVAPDPRQHMDFMDKARDYHPGGQLLMPVPEWTLRIALGEAADAVMDSAKVVPARLAERGFTFSYPTLDQALQKIYS